MRFFTKVHILPEGQDDQRRQGVTRSQNSQAKQAAVKIQDGGSSPWSFDSRLRRCSAGGARSSDELRRSRGEGSRRFFGNQNEDFGRELALERCKRYCEVRRYRILMRSRETACWLFWNKNLYSLRRREESVKYTCRHGFLPRVRVELLFRRDGEEECLDFALSFTSSARCVRLPPVGTLKMRGNRN